MPRNAGARLGPYEVLAPLGSGGMGEVYKARDTRLDRIVAIKILPADKLSNPESQQRFVQEAKAASALNHPNIVTIYDIATEHGSDFIVMEYVHGKTLDQLIARKGLRTSETLKYAIQIADAMAKAHNGGIIHRDLKPGNIMVTGEGQVKILDFGLAKLTERAIGPEDDTLSMHDLSQDGAIVGTVAYMSPEQADGRAVDARSDIFAVGSLLYEMLTGRKAFSGASRLVTLKAVVTEEPKPIEQFAADVPRDLDRIIRRCLRKDLERRFQHMADLKVALQEAEEDLDSGISISGVAAGRAATRRRGIYAAAVAFTLLVLGGWWIFGRSSLLPPRIAPFTSFGAEWDPAFSPDANLLAFAWAGPDRDNYDIYVQQIGAGNPLRLTTDAGDDRFPVFSPDGRYIAFTRDARTLMLVPALGGPERKITTVRSLSIDFSPDGKTIAVSDNESPSQAPGIVLVSVETGVKRRLTTPPPRILGDFDPRFSPDGQTIGFRRSILNTAEVRVAPVRGGEGRILSADNRDLLGLSWMPDGRDIVFSSRRGTPQRLWRVSASGGPPQQLSVGAENSVWPVVARRGQRLAYIRRVWAPHIWRLDLQSGAMACIIASTWQDQNPQFSPDGKKIAWVTNRSGSREIWVAKADGADSLRLTSMEASLARWSPDGRRIAFTGGSGGKTDTYGNADIYVVDAEGGAPKRITTDPAEDSFPCWSADGRWIYFTSDRTGTLEIWRAPAIGGPEQRITHKGGIAPQLSPDGRILYYRNQRHIWKVSPEGGTESLAMQEMVAPPLNAWQPFDDGIYFVGREGGRAAAEDRIQFFDFASNKIRTLRRLDKPAVSGLSVSPDRKQVIFGQVDRDEHDIMLVENFR